TSPPETGVTVSTSKSTMDTTAAQTTLPADTSTNPLPTETTTIATTEPTMTTTAITTTEALTTTDQTTTTPTPTVIPDPNQEPPPTLIDSNNGNGKSLQTWQIILIVVACLVVGIAIGAVILVGHIKRKRREMRFRRDSDLFGDGLGVVGDGGYHGASQRHSGASGTTAVGGGVGGIGGNNGTNASGTLGPGGLWLMEESQGHYQDEAVVAAAAMYPVSYQNDFYAGLGDGLTPDMAEIRHAHYQQQEQQDQRPASSAMYPATSAHYSPTRLSPSLSNQERSISRASNVSSGGGGNIAPSPSPGILQPLLEERLSDTDYIDDQGFGQTQKNQSQRESLETDLLTVSSRPESRVADNLGDSNRRAPVTVDPAQLESNALFEHVRASPQAIPGDSEDSNVAVAENTTTTNT
ncbi:hypothetical protein BGZ49_004838, partial [Haplosporangium sp. Z 27]